ncbi:thymidine phosphorylase [Candidatus Pacearchaeota archaeon]|nr:thymidine phosphorylase [Candidatus Pacearchaeota archaeon]
MKLKIKNFNWHAGKPVVFLNDKTAKRMNVFVDDRVAITSKTKVYAIVDIFPKLVKQDEIGVSHELARILKLRTGVVVEVSVSEMSDASFLIKKKINGEELSQKELDLIISEIVHNNLTEAEIAFFTAAEKINGMNFEETISLTKAMIKTGARLKFKGKYVADKHCIGGIAGNRTTPITVAICASVGLILPKTSSRAITSASGTADVIETISEVELPLKKIIQVVNKTGACLAWGGSLGLAPSDDKIIQVERLLNLDIEPQLLASVMAKKISAGAKHILIDIPFGRGAKVRDLEKAKSLGRKFLRIAKRFDLKMKVTYTDGTQPVGNGFGPVLEMLDIIKVFQNDGPQDLREKSIYLATELIKLCGIKDANRKASEALASGKAYEKFKEIINAQNGKDNFDEKIKNLKLGKIVRVIPVEKSGQIVRISNKGINSLCRILGTPETISAGVYLHKHLEKVKKGEPLLTLYAESQVKMKDALKFIKEFKPIEIE